MLLVSLSNWAELEEQNRYTFPLKDLQFVPLFLSDKSKKKSNQKGN